MKPQKDMEEYQMHINKWKKQIWKGYILYNSNFMTFWERHTMKTVKKVQWLPQFREALGRIGSLEDLGDSAVILHDTIVKDACHYSKNHLNLQHQEWTLL